MPSSDANSEHDPWTTIGKVALAVSSVLLVLLGFRWRADGSDYYLIRYKKYDAYDIRGHRLALRDYMELNTVWIVFVSVMIVTLTVLYGLGTGARGVFGWLLSALVVITVMGGCWVLLLFIAGLLMGGSDTGPYRRQAFFASKEVRTVLSLLCEAGSLFDATTFELVRSRIEKDVISRCHEYEHAIRDGTPPRLLVYTAIANTAGDCIQSGEFHLYRGYLNPMGPGKDLLNMFDAAIDELVRIGATDAVHGEE